MAISVFDLFKIGIGPSSSHTVGPMRAAYDFVQALREQDLLERVARIEAVPCARQGHGTDSAVIMGLMGAGPDRSCYRDALPRGTAGSEHADARWSLGDSLPVGT